MRTVSLVVPALNEAPGVPGLLTQYRALRAAHPGYAFELVLVDDGSTDGTADRLVAESLRDDAVTVVELSRNFGSHYAVSAGLAHAGGDCAIVLGADLQEPASLLEQFLERWAAGFEVVWGVRRSRVKRSMAYEGASRSFSYLFARFANLADYPPEGPSGVLVDRCVIEEVNRLGEHNRNVLALIAWVGFRQTRVEYDQLERRHGGSRWTRRTMVKLAVDSLIQFSSLPLRLCTVAGLSVAGLGVLYAVFLVVRAALGVSTPSGWPTVMVVVLVLGGVQLTVVGVMGEYLWRAVEETRGRPLYVLRGVRRGGLDDTGDAGGAGLPRPEGSGRQR